MTHTPWTDCVSKCRPIRHENCFQVPAKSANAVFAGLDSELILIIIVRAFFGPCRMEALGPKVMDQK